ncbi:hypothetical protein OE09_2026 [Flavobacteriaceae bacterium MAR_2010_72]|nr:hypothetical protein OE09_2026 [Flavobacteriaceae bacterium MAR_2010_72]
MYNYFFYFLYSHFDKPKWKEVNFPYLSTILAIASLQMLNFLFIRDLIYFQINGIKYKWIENEELIVPTLFIAFNFLYFKNKGRHKKILANYRKQKKNESRPLVFYISWLYIILSVVLAVAMVYSVRNFIKWFQ